MNARSGWRVVRGGCLAGLVAWAALAQAEVLSAHAVRQALDRGAVAWDLRPASGHAAGHLPGAVQADEDLLSAWEQGRSPAMLEAAVSAAGIDLSREVVLYGEAGDARAHALYRTLRQAAPGRVHWLVGGVAEWQQAGQSLSQETVTRRPVPQRLAALRGDATVDGESPRMAADTLRHPRPWDGTPLLNAQAD